MIFVGAALFLVSFIALIKVLGLVEKTTVVVNVAKIAFSDLRNSEMDDEAKEAALQAHAKRLFTLFFLITICGMIALFLPVVLILALEQIDVLSVTAVMTTLLSWEFLLASTVFGIALLWITRRH